MGLAELAATCLLFDRGQCQFCKCGWEDSPGEENGYPLQYSGLENSIVCMVHGVAKSQT